MFFLDPSLTRLDATRESVASIAESVNHPHVGVPGREAQPTSGFVVGLRNEDGTYAIYVYLWLTRTRESVIYGMNDRRLHADEYAAAQNEAFQFCESMGFIMEGLGYRNLAPEVQEELLAKLPPFQQAPAPNQLEGSPTLQAAHAGPSMNSQLVAAATPGPEVPIELLEPAPESAEPVDTSRLARLLASF
ncbi:MAG TPA: hypothetical protein VN033_03195 [Vulgatibacter sp.]|nr:hypothetical protein [Vulgatibacter sp.]